MENQRVPSLDNPSAAQFLLLKVRFWLQNQPTRNYPKPLRTCKNSNSLSLGSVLRVTYPKAPSPSTLGKAWSSGGLLGSSGWGCHSRDLLGRLFSPLLLAGWGFPLRLSLCLKDVLCGRKATSSGSRQTGVQIPAQPLTRCLTLGKSILCGPQFLPLSNGGKAT